MHSLYPSQRLFINLAALGANWRRIARMSDYARCGAAVKADGYGLGAGPVAKRLADEGCRTFFVATLDEGLRVRETLPEAEIFLLHGTRAANIPSLRSARLTPVINTPEQAQAWRPVDLPCAVMLDTGINRLGFGPEQFDATAGLQVSLVMSHLACADEPDHPLNAQQLTMFKQMIARWPQARSSLCNSAGCFLGADYHHDLIRPGIALYGGYDGMETVVDAQALVMQRRIIPAGQTVGYSATWRAERDTPVATIALGYADGYMRSFSNTGVGFWNGIALPVIGRVSMDMVTLDCTAAPSLFPGEWVSVIGGKRTLKQASQQSGLSEYEIITSLGARYARQYRR